MKEKQLRTVVGNLRRMIGSNPATRITDAQLLERFLAQRDELAFEMLVWRHGSMVLNVCRRVLRDTHEAEDAFQATFLIFVRKLGSIGKRQAVGSWLFKVAYRVALRARERQAVRAQTSLPDHDNLAGNMAIDDPAQRALWNDLRLLLDEEVNRLPEKYRTPFVLFYLEGMAYPDVAEELGCPKGTVSSRLTTAKGLLRKRLLRRGVGLSAMLLSAVLAKTASAALTNRLTNSTMQTLRMIANGILTPGASARAVSLAEGVLKTMMMTKMKLAAVVLLAAGVLGFGMSVAVQHAVQGAPPASADGPDFSPSAFEPPPVAVKAADPNKEPYGIVIGSPTPYVPGPEKPAAPKGKAPPQNFVDWRLLDTGEATPAKAEEGLAARLLKIEERLAKLEAQMTLLQAKPGDQTTRLWDPNTGRPVEANPGWGKQPTADLKISTVEKLQTIDINKFTLPIRMDQDKAAAISTAELYLSADRGKNWKLAAKLNEKGDAFDVTVPHDGEFWFKVHVIYKFGPTPAPEFYPTTTPDLKVLVHTKNATGDDADALLTDLEAELQAIQKRIADLKAKQQEKPGKKAGSPER
jgi:RNA polymerase sigma factor (sigma-70 family)